MFPFPGTQTGLFLLSGPLLSRSLALHASSLFGCQLCPLPGGSVSFPSLPCPHTATSCPLWELHEAGVGGGEDDLEDFGAKQSPERDWGPEMLSAQLSTSHYPSICPCVCPLPCTVQTGLLVWIRVWILASCILLANPPIWVGALGKRGERGGDRKMTLIKRSAFGYPDIYLCQDLP